MTRKNTNQISGDSPNIYREGRKEEAQYRIPELPEWQGNPYLAAMPPIPTDEDHIIDFLTVRPEYSESDRHLPSELRMHKVTTLNRFLQPSHHHIDLFHKMSTILYGGYVGRNPLDRGHFSRIPSDVAKILSPSSGDFASRSIPTSTSVFGLSSVGKTEATKRVLSYFPQVIYHSQFMNQQLVYLRVECPDDARPTGFFSSFFRNYDAALGTTTHKKYVEKTHSSQNLMMAGLATEVQVAGLGLLVVDEVQRLAGIRAGARRKRDDVMPATSVELMEFLVRLQNEAGIPILFIGTPEARTVFSLTFRMLRRTARAGAIQWDRMNRTSTDWDIFMNALWELQYTCREVPLTDELKDMLYNCSAGIAGIAVAVYKETQAYSIHNGIETITTHLIRKVFEEQFADWVRPIDALVEGNNQIIQQYEDLYFAPSERVRRNFVNVNENYGHKVNSHIAKTLTKSNRKDTEKTSN